MYRQAAQTISNHLGMQVRIAIFQGATIPVDYPMHLPWTPNLASLTHFFELFFFFFCICFGIAALTELPRFAPDCAAIFLLPLSATGPALPSSSCISRQALSPLNKKAMPALGSQGFGTACHYPIRDQYSKDGVLGWIIMLLWCGPHSRLQFEWDSLPTTAASNIHERYS